MEYNELIRTWNQVQPGLENTVEVNHRLIKMVGIDKIRKSLYEIKWTAYFELVVALVWVPFLVRFSIEHLMEFHFALPAFILLGISLFSIAVELRKLWSYYGLTPSLPVVKMQKKLNRLRLLEQLETNSLYVIIPLFSAPFFIVMAKAFLGIDLYFLGPVLLTYTLGSVVVAITLAFILKRFPNKQLRDSIAFLQELSKTEKED